MFDKAPNMVAAVPLHLSAAKPSLDPYGHLLRMLVPRATGIAFYDSRGTPLWIADSYDGPDPQPLVEDALAAPPPATTAQIDGFLRDFEGAPAYVFRLRDDGGGLVAIAVLLTRDGEDRPFSFIQNLARPALECLQREFQARVALGLMSRDLQTRDGDLDLLLQVAPDDPDSPEQADELAVLLQTCVDHLDCVLGAMVVPERNVALCKTRGGGKPQTSILTATHRHLLNFSQLQRRPLIINKVNASTSGLPPYKILSVPVRHSSGRVQGFLALFRPADGGDFDRRGERMAELLSRKTSAVLQSNYDAATSLLTRGTFERQVRAALAGRDPGTTHCMLYVDADRMHVINDNFGMHVGDEAICKIAEVLRRRPRPGALAARISGDRFALFLPDCDLDTAASVAQMLCDECAAQCYVRPDGKVQVSVSIGVAEMPDSQAPFAHGLASAELACKAAKERGRGRAEMFQDADQSIMRRHADVLVVQRLHEALEHDRFTLYAQAILPLTEGTTEPRFELLLRMLGENGEVLPPEKFMSAAERYQLMPQVDRWVVRHALGALKSQAGILGGRQLRFSINLSGSSIADEDFVGFLEQELLASGLPPELLCFEVTETAAVSDVARADRLMQRMRAHGCSFALDDFGTGLSSLAYLKALPVTVLKIDGSFVRDAATNQRSESMIRAIAQLAHTMGMETVAEYVETDELRMRMASLGVDFGQGFAVGRPIPLEDILGDLALSDMMAAEAVAARQGQALSPTP